MVCLIFLCRIAHTYESPLFVSLGADCLTSSMIKHFGKRQASFPFDWSVTPDETGFVQLLKSNFVNFLDDKCLALHPINGCLLVHSLYHIEFTHEKPEELEKFQTKYQRRIERFRQLANYNGTVVFIRLLQPAYPNPDLYWFDYLPYANEKVYAFELYGALKSLFPELDFKLITVSKTDAQNRMEVYGNISMYYFSNIQEHRFWECFFH